MPHVGAVLGFGSLSNRCAGVDAPYGEGRQGGHHNGNRHDAQAEGTNEAAKLALAKLALVVRQFHIMGPSGVGTSRVDMYRMWSQQSVVGIRYALA